MQNIKIRKLGQRDRPEIIKIAKNLHDWFDNYALTFEIPNDLNFHQGYVAECDGKIVGFLTYSSFEGEVFISWLGVLPDYQRKGIGQALVHELEEILITLDINKLKVETLSEKIKYEPYVRTRKFYRKIGFTQITSRKVISNVINKKTNEELELVTLQKDLT
ncbi:MAG: GNAT family N-acetyltransferase [Patescibacteria group bacterium]|jgi:ribosomal protein S18 acetylase RimI-like enzyme